MHVSKSRRLLKPCFVEQCPHCRRVGEFWLVELSGSVGPFAGIGYSVACKACSFEKLVSNAEAKRLDALAHDYSQLIAGFWTVEAFHARIDALRLPALEQIKAEARAWRCTTCTEENPMSFDLCWKCGGASPVPSNSAPESPKLPDVGGRYAWE
jgi:hypothetical protein